VNRLKLWFVRNDRGYALGEPLMKQELGGTNDRLKMKSLTHDVVVERVVNADQRHPLVMGKKGLHNMLPL
jgi:hypothetical protein